MAGRMNNPISLQTRIPTAFATAFPKGRGFAFIGIILVNCETDP